MPRHLPSPSRSFSCHTKHLPTLIILACALILILGGCTASTTDTASVRAETGPAVTAKRLGEAYMAQGDYIAALRQLLEAEKALPDDPVVQFDLGMVYLARERYTLARQHLINALGLNPGYTEARNSLGVVYLRQKKWDAAIQMFQQTVSDLLYMTPHFAYTNMGRAYMGKKAYSDAEACFRKALKTQPGFTPANHGLATVYLETGRLSQARQLLERAVSKNPDHAILHADLGRTLQRMGRYKEARAAWHRVIYLVPDSPLADEADRQINRIPGN